jgi:hypothetical protein
MPINGRPGLFHLFTDVFNTLLRETDFREAAGKFGTSEVDRSPALHWLFNAYFVTERDFLSLNLGA